MKLYWRRMVHPDLPELFYRKSLLGFYSGIVPMPINFTSLIFLLKKTTVI